MVDALRAAVTVVGAASMLMVGVMVGAVTWFHMAGRGAATAHVGRQTDSETGTHMQRHMARAGGNTVTVAGCMRTEGVVGAVRMAMAGAPWGTAMGAAVTEAGAGICTWVGAVRMGLVGSHRRVAMTEAGTCTGMQTGAGSGVAAVSVEETRRKRAVGR